MPTMSENKKAGKADTFLSWTLGVLACLWVAWCCGIGPLYWFGTGLADFGWANVLYMAIAFVVSFAILWSLVRYGRGERVLPTYFSRRYVKLCQEVSGTPTTVLGIMLRHLSDAAHSRPGRAIHAVIVWIGRKLTRCTDCWWKLMLLFVIGWLWIPTTLLAAYGADIRSQIREFSWALNQWTGLKQPYIGFFSFVPMDIYPTAHYMWPANPTYLTDQHNIVLTVFYGAFAAVSRYFTDSNDAGIVALAALQWLFAAFCCAATANRFFNLPWRRLGVGTFDFSHPERHDCWNMRDFTHPEAGVVARPSRLRAGAKTRFVILLFFMVCPLAVFATISLTKSPLFAFAFVWWFGVWYELHMTHIKALPTINGKPMKLRKRSLAALFMSSCVMLISAKYAWYIILFAALLAIINDRKRWKTYVVALMLPTVLIHGGLVYLVNSGAVIGGDPIESRGIQLQQIARVAKYNPQGIPEDAAKKLAPVFNLDQMAIINDRKRWKTYVVALMLPTVLIHGGLVYLVNSGAVIGGDPIESRGIQLQQIARVAKYNPQGIPEDAAKKLAPVFNLDQMAESYFQQDADPVKSSGIQSKKVSYKWRTVTKDDMKDFNDAWWQIVKANPQIALDALFAECFGYFNVTDLPYVSMDYYVNNDYVQSDNEWIHLYNHQWRNQVAGFAKKWGQIPVLGWVTHGNLYVTLTLLIGAAEVVLRRWRSLSWHLPLLLLMGVMITAPANNFERHMLPIAFVFGFLCLEFWRESRAARLAAREASYVGTSTAGKRRIGGHRIDRQQSDKQDADERYLDGRQLDGRQLDGQEKES